MASNRGASFCRGTSLSDSDPGDRELPDLDIDAHTFLDTQHPLDANESTQQGHQPRTLNPLEADPVLPGLLDNEVLLGAA